MKGHKTKVLRSLSAPHSGLPDIGISFRTLVSQARCFSTLPVSSPRGGYFSTHLGVLGSALGSPLAPSFPMWEALVWWGRTPSGLGTPPCSRTEPRRGGAGRGALPHPSQGRVGFSSTLLPFSCGQLDKPLRLVRCQLPNWHFGAVVPSERWLWDSAQGAPRASRGAGPGRPPKCRFPSGLRSSRHRGCWGDRPVCISWGT